MTLDIVRAFSEARERASAAVRAGGNGIEVSRALSSDVDAIVVEAAGREVAKCTTPVAVFATGGFGRCELAPYSDLDLLVLCAKTPGPEVQTLAEAILYPLWDAKVDAGHAVRSYDQALSLPASDLAAATALLDARFLTGDEDAGAPLPGCVPQAGGEDGRRGLRGPSAGRADGPPQPVRRHDLSPRARSQEWPRWHARSLRRPLGGDGPFRDFRSQGAPGQGGDDRAPGAGVRRRHRVAAAGPDRHACRGRAPDGSPALRAAGGDRAGALSRRAGSRRRHPPGGSPGGRGADAPVPRARQADSQRDRAAAAAGDRARRAAPPQPARSDARRRRR